MMGKLSYIVSQGTYTFAQNSFISLRSQDITDNVKFSRKKLRFNVENSIFRQINKHEKLKNVLILHRNFL